MSIAIFSHDDCLKHEMGSGHPKSPARVKAIQAQLEQSPVLDSLIFHKSPVATKEQLLLAHSERLVSSIFEQAPKDAGNQVQIDPDTSMNSFSLAAALRASGAAVAAIDTVMDSTQQRRAFCNVRPPGHHAEHDKAMGFCFFNSVAIAAKYALHAYDLSRVAIVDFDVHHGNGTEDIVSDDPRILFCSTYQHPFYPGSAAPSKAGQVANAPLQANSGSLEFREAVNAFWLPELNSFEPELILISAGFDAHQADHLAQLNLLEDDYHWVTQALCKVANQYANGKIVSMLEGGYNTDALARSVEAHIQALLEK